MEIEGEWREMSTIESKEVYWKLLKARTNWGEYEPRQAHKSLKQIKQFMSPKERDYW